MQFCSKIAYVKWNLETLLRALINEVWQLCSINKRKYQKQHFQTAADFLIVIVVLG